MKRPDDALQDKLNSLSPAQREALLAKLKQRKSDKPRQINNFAEKPILPIGRENNQYPLSFAQKRLWFMEQLAPGNPAYNIAAAIEITGEINAKILEQTFLRIIQRHESLRTRFGQSSDGAYQYLVESVNWKLGQHDLSNDKDALGAAIHQEANTGFALDQDYLMRANLYQTDYGKYVLTIVMHHIISDAWSSQILLAEVTRIYTALLQNTAAALPAPRIQYIDFAHWQKQLLNEELLGKQLHYWKNKLAGYENLNLYTNKPRPAFITHNGGHHRVTLNTHDVNALQTLCQKKGTTLFNGLLVVFQALLSRYSHQTDFCIGIPVAGRHYPGVESLIGFFVNTLAIKADISQDDTFISLLEKVRHSTLEAQSNADIPFEQLVDEIVQIRDSSISPIFQVLFSHNPGRLEDQIKLPGVSCNFIDADLTASKYEISLITRDTENGLSCHFEYNSDLYSAETITQMAQHFIHLVQLASSTPTHHLDSLSLFETGSMHKMLGLDEQGINRTEKNTIFNTHIHKQFESQVSLYPDRLAVSDDNTSLTYYELNLRANQVAQHLAGLGVTPGDLVGVCLGRSVNMIISLMGILKSGCAYVPFDPDFPIDRLTYMVSDTNIKTLICDKFTEKAAQKICDDTLAIESIKNRENIQNPDINLDKDALFNVIYTSGSTGTPKGVMVPHIGISNRLSWMQESFPLDETDCTLQKTPYSFDVSVWELFWPLLTGSHYHFLSPEDHKVAEKVRDAIIEKQITTLHFVPSMLGNFLNCDDIENCTSLKQVFCSGEALLTEHANNFANRLPHSHLINLYGPTEASIDVSYYCCVPNEKLSSIPIGKPIYNTQLHVLDSELRPLPTGIAGELYIGGVGLALGYLNMEEHTAKSFIDNPFFANGHPSEKLYKTGDLACWSNDGNLIYLGRNDHQVKIRGNRIELGEIETHLAQLDDVADAVVVAQTVNQQMMLVAFLCTSELQAPHHYKHLLKQYLPEYMIPTAFCAIEQLPLSANGKIDRKKLPQIETGQLHKAKYIAPSTAIEKTLAGIWENLLTIEKVGIHDNFFELGGHSLLATTLLTRIRESFNIELPLKTLFEINNIEGLAKVIAAMSISSNSSNDAISDNDEDFEEGIL